MDTTRSVPVNDTALFVVPIIGNLRRELSKWLIAVYARCCNECPLQIDRPENPVFIKLETVLIVEVDAPKFVGVEREPEFDRRVEPREDRVGTLDEDTYPLEGYRPVTQRQEMSRGRRSMKSATSFSGMFWRCFGRRVSDSRHKHFRNRTFVLSVRLSAQIAADDAVSSP